MRAMALLLMCLLPWAALAQDSRVPFLEQEVRRLEREMQTLSRRLDALERPLPAELRPSATIAARPPVSQDWIDAAKWRRLQPGMGELEVVSLLGPPTSMREANGARVLFYAIEIGASGFLGGSVTLRERVVAEIKPPVLQ